MGNNNISLESDGQVSGADPASEGILTVQYPNVYRDMAKHANYRCFAAHWVGLLLSVWTG